MNQVTTTIDLGGDFSRFPAGRHQEDGEHNAERFRNELLVPALRKYQRVEVGIDNTEGLAASFLEEAFGGLVRTELFSPEFLSTHLAIVAKKPTTQFYKTKILEYMLGAPPKDHCR